MNDLIRTLLAAAVALAIGITTAAHAETGTSELAGADFYCFRIQIKETGARYAVDYTSTSTPAAIGLIAMLVDYSAWTTITVETDGTYVDCGDGGFYRLTGVQR